MPESNDNTKLLLPYIAVFRFYEKDYRHTPLEQRDSVINDIAEEIEAEAEKNGATILEGHALQKVCVYPIFQHGGLNVSLL